MSLQSSRASSIMLQGNAFFFPRELQGNIAWTRGAVS